MTLFQSTSGRQNILVAVDLDNENVESNLWSWLEEKHNQIFWDIEMHEGGSIRIQQDEIIFSGDNGIFVFEAVEIETV
jgi:hypothetical protein